MMNQTGEGGQMFGSTMMTAASSSKPPTAYSPYHPGQQPHGGGRASMTGVQPLQV